MSMTHSEARAEALHYGDWAPGDDRPDPSEYDDRDDRYEIDYKSELESIWARRQGGMTPVWNDENVDDGGTAPQPIEPA